MKHLSLSWLPGFTGKRWPASLLLLFLVQQTVTLRAQEKVFIRVPGGVYQLGKQNHPANPLHQAKLAEFELAATETTNREFDSFVRATHYKTDAERFRNARVFKPGLGEFEWMDDSTACWRFPNGVSRGGIEKRMDHPVTCISFHDIEAYCRWSGYRLPTLDEWEVAARAGTRSLYFFGDSVAEITGYANIWHAYDHLNADTSDGYMYTAPVASFKANPWGFYDLYGNVFEFCADRPAQTAASGLAAARGGSWWCSSHSCGYFNSVDIGRVHPRASFSNQGFRVVRQ